MAANSIKKTSGRPLYHIFTRIPDRYDLINHVITLGMDSGWRRQAALICLKDNPGHILDICCGTGDLAITMARLAPYTPEITGADYSQPMLEIAAAKASAAGVGNIRFVNADVAHLPFPDGHFDCITISFAFRNLTYNNPMTEDYLNEILRVLRPDGRFVIVESSQPKSRFIRFLDHLYLKLWVFPAGYLISGNREAYKYLAESAEHFYSAEEMQEYLVKEGFKQATAKRLFFGAAAIYTATK
ncbi:MAG: ubiquinone/menaquinone biosynthesis methyltransferase [Dehalococcoidia bacterium]|jgi:demethylmenaquinone methyltransferase/2-methoxy-6-polyprenyl-1,4-benzoquinol methylase